ncbi:SPFH domain-containing protein [Streptantibioticus parmotrematis]
MKAFPAAGATTAAFTATGAPSLPATGGRGAAFTGPSAPVATPPGPDAAAGLSRAVAAALEDTAELAAVPEPAGRREPDDPRASPPEPRSRAPWETPAAADAPGERQGHSRSGGPAVVAGCAAVAGALWTVWRLGVLPAHVAGFTVLPAPPAAPDAGHAAGMWGAVMLLAAFAAYCVGGLTRGRPGTVWLLTRCGAYRGTVRHTGLLWINPLLGRRRVDVRLRHWRSRPLEAADAGGARLHVTVLLVWRVRDTAKACFAVDDYERYLREQVEGTVTRVLSRLPADDFRGTGHTLRDTEYVGDALTRALAREMRPVGIEVFSARPVRVAYAPEVAEVMRRRHLAVLDARRRRAVLDDVVASVAETVRGLTERGLVAMDDGERKALVKDLTVAFCTASATSMTRTPGTARRTP